MEWDSSLECGVEQVDNEHKRLFKMVEELGESVKSAENTGILTKALDFLSEYVIFHFAHEEALMDECGYPKKQEHSEQHAAFVQTFIGLKQKYHDSHESRSAVRDIYLAAAGWLINHIKVIDLRFMQYYKEHTKL